MNTEAMGAMVPDTKDWTWVLQRPCPECGFDATAQTVDRIPVVIRDNATTWEAVLTLNDAAVRPDPSVWSPLEYACHVRDVHRIFDQRVAMMLDEDDPRFPNWDQDESAVEQRYGEQDPATVATELLDAATRVAERYESVPPGAWSRRGIRSNGSEFTIETLGLYHLHDIVHHAWDVRDAAKRATIAAYDGYAAAYADGLLAAGDLMEEHARAFAAAVGPGARVLEIGSGPGRDAALLEDLGVDVRRTDVTPAFVELLRSRGHAADVVDPLTDDLDDPDRPGTPYDGVWASASLLHVARADLPVVLERLAAATRAGGVLGLWLKEGDGEAWSTHGFVGAPRLFVYWRKPALRAVLDAAGWEVDEVHHTTSTRTGEPWLDVRARRRP
jgi:SAM-dependent methyltransferase